ncbi:hypothetical protein niasHT_025504 [Heterodera trifolii]|uniref:Peptidase M12A domain-containing protein n=1 Tax=Heterodera trifolii TaxID=157864 RepID=A0ABD2J8P1_9BILA
MNSISLLIVIFCLIVNCSAPPIRPLSSDVGIWKLCNGKNGKILVENSCTKLLLCYQSEMAKNKKIGKRFGVGKGTIGKLKFVECAEEIGEDQWHDAESLGNELQEALSSAAFFDDFMPFVLAFEFGTTFCAENGGTTKLCKEKCLSQSLVAPKTKAPTKFHGTTPRTMPKTTFGIVPTTEQTFGFVPFARNVDHFGTNCTNIFFPMEVVKFLLNITITPYDVGCKKYQRPLKMKDPEEPPSEKHRYFDACNKVPTEEKCENSEELIGCYKSSKKWPGNSPIAEMCQKHLEGISGGADANANVAGFIVKICAHRNENDLVIESTFNISFSNETCKRTRTFPISLEKITDITNWMPTFLIEFGTDQRKSAIREKGDEKSICEGLKTSDGIGTILKDIAPQMVNGTLAKMIHFVPPSKDDKMRAFFQIERPKFSKRITNDTDLLPYKNDPNNTRRATPCDYYGADCVPIRNLLLKIEALANCGKNESENNAAFKKPDWAPLPPAMTWKKPSETMLCEGDMFCDKQTLREQYNRLREICGLKPEEVENQRKKRQYNPYEKWTESPIKIAFNKDALPKDGYQQWKDAIKIGAALIVEVTCVQFEFVDEMVKGQNGIAIADDEFGACGASPFGRVGGWQFLQLAMTDDERCTNNFNMSVVACHELLHALGFKHEQSRSDGRNYIILRKFDGQSEIDPNTQNFDFPYDFGSVMHYPSGGDHEEHEDKCQNGGYLNPNDCTKCHCPDGYGGDYCKALEENLNCEDLSGIPRELVANQSAVSMKTKAKCAKLCCPRALTDLNGNEYKNWIAAEKPDMDIVISAHLSPKWTVPSTVFELTYESGNVRMFFSSKCVKIENLYAEKRNPGTGTLYCYDGLNNRHYACSCNGDKKCLAEEKYEHDSFICPIIKVNGIQIHGSRQTMHTDPKHYHYNSTQIDVNCFKAEGGTVSFWVYRNPETGEMIRVDEVHCLTDKAAAGVPKQFKSLPVEEQLSMKLSPTNPFLAKNNASSLIHVHGFDDIFGTEQTKNTEKYLEINLTKNAEPLGNELREALSSAAFFDDFMPFVLAFEFGAKFCAENSGTTKLCKEKCFTKAPFVGTTKSHGCQTKTTSIPTTTSIQTTTEEQTFSFWPFAEFVSHFGTNCSKIVFPVEVAKFIVNITARPYRIACNDYEKEYEIGQLPPHYLEDSYKDFFNACMSVPTTKCAKHAELNACYKSIKPVVPSNNAIAKLCQDHLNETNVAGFAVQICIHRDEKEQKLVFETFLNLSTTDKFIKMTRSYQISIEEIMKTKKTIPIFFLEFGTDHQQSAIREQENGEVISETLNENSIGIGTVLNDIKAEEINESLAKMIHLVPPVADRMKAFFQIPTPKFNKLISAQTNLKQSRNDPKKG